MVDIEGDKNNKVEQPKEEMGVVAQTPEGVEVPTASVGKEEVVTPKESPKNPLMRSIRTYANDIAGLVGKGVSQTDIALSEQKRKKTKETATPTAPVAEKKRSGSRAITFIALFLVLAGIIIVVASLFFREKEDPQVAGLVVAPVVFANSQKEIEITDLDRTKILEKINTNREIVNIPLNTIVNLYITEENLESKRLVKPGEFLKRIDVGASGAFIRALGEHFMLGVHAFDGNQGFLLFEIKSFDNAFAEALNWERFLLDDLWPMFYNQRPQERTFFGGEGSIFNEGFMDVVIENRDTRALKNKNNETILIYSFPDRRHLLIATNEDTLSEVLDRLTTGRFKK